MWYQYFCRRPLLLCMQSKKIGELGPENDFIKQYFKRGFRYESILV